MTSCIPKVTPLVFVYVVELKTVTNLKNPSALGSVLHLATATQIFDVVTIIFHVVRKGLHGHQCNCSHMTTEKTHRCRQVGTGPYGISSYILWNVFIKTFQDMIRYLSLSVLSKY